MTHEHDIHLTRALTDESIARTASLKAGAIKAWLFGSSALVVAVGVAIAMMIAASHYRSDTAALTKALAEAPALKLELPKEGLKLADNEVELKQPALVELNDGAKILAELKDVVSKQATVDAPKATKDGTPIRREVTVFSKVTYLNGEVHSGWEFPSGSATVPTYQFCYYTLRNADGSDLRTEIGVNGQPVREHARLVPSFDKAFANCVWFQKGRTVVN